MIQSSHPVHCAADVGPGFRDFRGAPAEGDTMAKGQKKSNKEVRKPKQAKAAPAPSPLFKTTPAPGTR